MDTRVAVISIIVENPAAIEELNHYLHEAGEYIIGRMGIPYREKGINIISIAIDAPQDWIQLWIFRSRLFRTLLSFSFRFFLRFRNDVRVRRFCGYPIQTPDLP